MVRTTFRTLVTVCGLLWLGSASQAANRLVPSQYATIQAGIDAAQTGDTVLVADGTYTGTGNRQLTFRGKAITVRSASNNPAGCILDIQGLRGVLFNSRETSASVLSGFTIKNGGGSGAGISCTNSSPTITRCILMGNQAPNPGGVGGGMYNENASPTVTYCTFVGNSADHGGGMYNTDSAVTVTNCTFRGNTAARYGGGIYSQYNQPVINRCTFIANVAQNANGGGMYNKDNTALVTNCSFFANRVNSLFGGGIDNQGGNVTVAGCDFVANSSPSNGGGGLMNDNSTSTVTNCTFALNNGSGGYQGGGILNGFYGVLTVTNCIFWGNYGGGIARSQDAVFNVTYCDSQDYANTAPNASGNFKADPLFLRTPSAGGDNAWGTGDDDYGDLRLYSTSPCRDMGNNAAIPAGVTYDRIGMARIHGVRVDIGAYESPYPNGSPTARITGEGTFTIPHDGDPNTNTYTFTLDGSQSSDPDGDLLKYEWIDGFTDVGFDSNLTVSRPAGTYTFVLGVYDPTDAAQFVRSNNIEILAEPNQAPTTPFQSFGTNQDTPLSITLYATDPENDALTYTITTPPSHGTLSGTGASRTYTPDPGYAGADGFIFKVNDSYGATAAAIAYIDVFDTAAPVITLNGSDPMTVAQNTPFTDPGATAEDNRDGSVPVTVSGTVNTASSGSYILTYTATDSAGNTTMKTRTVNVVSLSKIVLSVNKITRQKAKVTVAISIKNTGSAAENNVTLKAATLIGVNTSNTMPILRETIKAGKQKTATLAFKGFASGQSGLLIIQGASNKGDFSLTQSVTIP